MFFSLLILLKIFIHIFLLQHILGFSQIVNRRFCQPSSITLVMDTLTLGDRKKVSQPHMNLIINKIEKLSTENLVGLVLFAPHPVDNL